ncbi:hypothetical protein S83_052107 [Arachis hypogaea]
MAMSHTKTKMEEAWTIEEVAFNVPGLSVDCFIPPVDLRTGSILYIIAMVVRMELKNHEDGELLVRTYQCNSRTSTVHHENVYELSTRSVV